MTSISNNTNRNGNTCGKPIRMWRKIEGLVGVPLADLLGRLELKNSGLVGPKKVYLPKSRLYMHYYEREAETETETEAVSGQCAPTILLFHGIGSHGQEFCSFLRQQKQKTQEQPNLCAGTIRILVPELIGHGQDLERVRNEGVDSFEQPTADILLSTMSEFLDVAKVGSNCNAMGTSLGGALLYFLKRKRPDVIQKTILIAPALPCFLTESFLGGLVQNKHRFLDFQSREDVKHLFRDILWTDPRKRRQNRNNNNTNSNGDGYGYGCKDEQNGNGRRRRRRRPKKDPFPKVAYEVIYRLTQRNVPDGHFKALQDKLIAHHGKHMVHGKEYGNKNNSDANGDNHDCREKDDVFGTTIDLDPDSPRLVVWPEEDQICSLEKGKCFFGPSVKTGKTTFQTISNCGHVFDENGTNIYDLLGPIVTPYLLDFVPDSDLDSKKNEATSDGETLYGTVESC